MSTNPSSNANDPHERLLALHAQLQKDLDELKKQGRVLASKLQSAVDAEKIDRIHKGLE